MNGRLWIGVLAGPIGFLVALEAKYALVGTICRNHAEWILWAITAAGLLFCVIGAFASSPGWRAEAPRPRFMGISGAAISAMFAVAIIAMAVPDLFFRACD